MAAHPIPESDLDAITAMVARIGRNEARGLVSPEKRPLVDVAAEVLGDDAQRIGTAYTGWCLTSLPHKRLADDAPWERQGKVVSLLVEPGRLRVTADQAPRLYGVPYGARARMILLYLQTHAVRHGSRRVQLGASMAEWLRRMGYSKGGETWAGMRDQAARIAACSLKFFWHRQPGDAAGPAAWAAGRFVAGGLSFAMAEPGQGSLWEEEVLLDATFFDALTRHAVPLQEAALRALHDRSMSLDIYVWLAYRLHQLPKAAAIRWPALYAQFGAGYKAQKQWKPRYIEALRFAVAAYPGARVELADEGIILHPSPPPVAAALVSGHRLGPGASPPGAVA